MIFFKIYRIIYMLKEHLKYNSTEKWDEKK